MRTVTIVGVGRVGSALSNAISASGYEIQRLVSKDIAAAKAIGDGLAGSPSVTGLEGLAAIESELLFITTQDSKIRSTAERIAALGKVADGFYAFHCSGALSSDELSSLAKCGYRTASVHPLVSISDSKASKTVFNEVFFAVEGDPEAVRVASKLVEKIGGRVFELAGGSKSLYHAAAVVACGHLVALFATSIRMLSHCGLDESTARKVMLPLVESTIANLRDKSPDEALTGPFARGDVEVIAEHLQKLAEIADENMDGVYRSLGHEAIELAARQGVSDEKIAQMREIILLDKSNTKW